MLNGPSTHLGGETIQPIFLDSAARAPNKKAAHFGAA
jgi:hypothetical protein